MSDVVDVWKTTLWAIVEAHASVFGADERIKRREDGATAVQPSYDDPANAEEEPRRTRL